MKNTRIEKKIPKIADLFSWTKKSILFLCLIFSFGLHAQNVDLVIQKTGPNVKHIGEVMTYTISISNNGPSTAIDAIFTDTFPDNVSNVVFGSCVASGGAVCPSVSDYSISNVLVGGVNRTVLNGTIPNLPFGGQIDMTIDLNAPSADVGGGASFSNTAYVYAPVGLTETVSNTNRSTWNVTLLNDLDIEVISNHTPTGSLGDCSTFPKTLEYSVQWVNHGPSVADGIEVMNRLHFHERVFYGGAGTASFWYPWEVSNVQWTSSSVNSIAPSSSFNFLFGESLPKPLAFLSGSITENNSIVTEWAVGDTIGLTYTLDIAAPNIINCERSMSWEVLNQAKFEVPSNFNLLDTDNTNNFSHTANTAFCSAPLCPRVDIEVIKQNTPTGSLGDCIDLPTTVDYVVQWVNHGPDSADGTRLSEGMSFLIGSTTGLGLGAFKYPWEISNLQWFVSSPATSLPTEIFSPLSGIEDSGGFSSLSATVDTWALGDTITLTYSTTISPPVITGCGITRITNLRNIATYSLPVGNPFIDPILLNNIKIIDNAMSCTSSACAECDIEVVKLLNPNLGNCSTYPKTIAYTTQWINNGPSVAPTSRIYESLYFDHVAYIGTGNATYDFPWQIANMQWSVSSNNTTVSNTTFSNTSGVYRPEPISNPFGYALGGVFNNITDWASGDTIILTYDLIIEEPIITGCGRNLDWKPRTNSSYFIMNSSFADPNSTNNIVIIDNPISNHAIDLALSKSVSPVIVDYLDTLDLTLTFQNASGSSALSDVYWLDTLPSVLTLLPSTIDCVASGGASCPTVQYDNVSKEMRQDLNNFPSGGIVTITYRAIANTPYKVSETTRAWAINPCADCDEATNFTQTNFQIDGPLPVELLYFKVEKSDCIAQLDWSTASEENNDYFIIESSNNGIDFKEIGKLEGAGNSAEILKYTWTDKYPYPKNNYYRLKQVDFDGRFEYSNIVSIQFGGDCLGDFWEQAVIYPNPTKGIVMIEIEMEEILEDIQFTLIDILGNEMKKQFINLEEGQNTIEMNLSSFPTGTYFLQITNGKEMTKVFRIVTIK